MRTKGFSLIELLVVITIISLTFGLMMPAITRVWKLVYKITAPEVTNTIPQTYANDVLPSLDKITVTFSEPMKDKSWSWTGSGDKYPVTIGQPGYDKDRTTCTLPVKLEPGKIYWVGVNSSTSHNFKSANCGAPVNQYVILFATLDRDGKPTVIPEALLAKASKINSQN
jgi:prepilin-type N-terminal cleavage/methylation domain-containing protein